MKDIIQFIREILINKGAFPHQLEIIINNKNFSFFEGVDIIYCNKLSKNKYTIKYKDNTNIDVNKSGIFSLFDVLDKIYNENLFKYNFELKDTTKTKFYISIKISTNFFKELYTKIIKLDLPDHCQYVNAFTEGIHYYHYFNPCLTEIYPYNQNLIKIDKAKEIENLDNYIIIKCCHDIIIITDTKITFSERDNYKNVICKILLCLNYSSEHALIRFTPCNASFIYPISINFQLFDLMLYEYNLYPYIYTNESNDLIKNQEKLVYTVRIYNEYLNMIFYNKYKQFNETIQFHDLEWYKYLTVKKILNHLYLFYVNFHINYNQRKMLFSIPIKINYNRLFGKYYTRYFNNKDKVLPIIADKEYCIQNNISHVQWNNNCYRSPENSGYKIILSSNKKSDNNSGIPKCVRIIRKYKEKKEVVYFNISYELNEHCKGQFPSTLFISYGYELLDLYRTYFDIQEIVSKFKICSNCNTYISIPSQKYFLNTLMNLFNCKQLKILEKDFNFESINLLSFSIDNDMNVYPYGVFNHVYNFNSSFPFLIIILNTTKLYTLPNYRYEYLISSKSNWFSLKDDIVKAVFSMFKRNNISIIDNSKLKRYVRQYALESNNKTVLIAEKKLEEENCYLWRSIYSEIIPEIPIVSNMKELYDSLPSFSSLCKINKNISAYHYFKTNNDGNDGGDNIVRVFGIWIKDIYYPCKSSFEKLQLNIPNKPYLLVKRNLDGTFYSPKTKFNYIVF